MASQPISLLTTVTPTGEMLLPVVDPSQPVGLKNGNVTIFDLLASMSVEQYYTIKAAGLASLPLAPNPGGPPIWWNNGGVETWS